MASFASEYGTIHGGSCAVLAMGKLGSREMTAASDLDLVLLYDFDEAAPESDGERRLHAVQYFTRITQRLVSSLTAATRRGRLYEVDMRLRPSGGKGPVATQIRGFATYQIEEAETWEHMALTRARVIAGDPTLAQDIRAVIRTVLCTPRDADALRKAVRDMRRLIAREKGEADPWDLKLASGGLIDIEFLAQYLILRHAAEHDALVTTDTSLAIATAAKLGLIDPDDADVLIQAHRIYSTVTQMMRLTLDEAFDPAKVAKGVLRRIAAAADCPDFPRLERQLIETRQAVRTIFQRQVG